MDPQIVELKAWKNARKMGQIRIKPADILGPTDATRSRDFDPAHCAILKKRLQSTGSANARGVKLAVLNQAMENAWLSASDLDRVAMFTLGHQFYADVMAEPKYAIGGDHTRTAVTELHEEFPEYEKWKVFKKLTIIVSGTSKEAFQMCKDLGVMFNSKQYHKDMGFADRILLAHAYFEYMEHLGKGTRRSAEVTKWCDKQCALAGIPKNSWSQYSGAARLEGKSWLYMEAILKGKYGTAIKRGTLPGIVPTTQSPLVKLLTCPEDVIEEALKRVYNGVLSVAMLSNEADNYKAYAMTKQMIIWAVQVEGLQDCDELTVRRAYPQLMTRGFILSFVMGIKTLMKKSKGLSDTDCPPWIKSKVNEILKYKQQVANVCITKS